MMGPCRYKTKDSLGGSGCDRDPIWIAERLVTGEPIKASADLFNLSRVSQLIQCPRMDTQPERLRSPKGASVLRKNCPRLG